MWVGDEVIVGVGWVAGVRREMGDAKNVLFSGYTRYTFIISRTFARWCNRLVV